MPQVKEIYLHFIVLVHALFDAGDVIVSLLFIAESSHADLLVVQNHHS
jgi:hypothetical protein